MPPTGLYIHWPFCARICPYCDFTVARSRGEDASRWTDGLIADLERFSQLTGKRRLESIYFGGGTPSLMPPEEAARLIDRAAGLFDLPDTAEITLEANPTDAETARFEAFRKAGVNRLSLGIQSTDDDQLRFLGRNHNGAEAMRATERALACFDRVSLDFIYALPGETTASWRDRLSGIIALGAGHLSLYQLTIEKGTAFGLAVDRGDWAPAPEETAADLYLETAEVTAAADLPGYEVSNHARPGEEAVHNALYWQGADWIGIGPGAHGRLTLAGARQGIAACGRIADWSALSHEGRYAYEVLSDEQVTMELLAGGLRTNAGFDLRQLPLTAREAVRAEAGALAAEGYLKLDQEQLRIDPEFRLLTDYLVARLARAL